MTPGPGYFEDRQVPDKKLFLGSDTQNVQDVPLDKRHIFVDGSSPQTEVAMPNVSEAEGFRFIVEPLTVPGTTDAGVKVNISDGINGTQTVNITSAQTQAMFESDGIDWFVSREDA